jgi:serine/threonine-protein kinase
MKPGVRTTLWVLLGIGCLIALFGIGFSLFNFLVMPLLVKKGEEVEVPELVGLPLDQAYKILEAQHLSGEVGATRPDSLYPEGYVIEQSPESGRKAKVGRNVKLVVSTGPQLIRIPHLEGLNLSQAQSVAQNLSLRILNIDSMPSDSVPAGRIIGVAPAPGSEVPPGSGIELMVSLGAEGRMEMPNLTGLKLTQAIDLLEEFQLCLGEVEEVAGDPDEAEMVLVQSPQAGMLVAPGDTVNLIVIKGGEGN